MKERSSEERLARLEDIHEVLNLSNLYCRLLSSGGDYYEEIEGLFAQKGPDPTTVEIFPYGPVIGTEELPMMYTGMHRRWLWDEVNNKGKATNVFVTNTTGVIELAGDRQTAKELTEGTVFLTFDTSVPDNVDPNQAKVELIPMFFQQRRATDFIKEDGVWKIWHYRVPGCFRFPMGGNWVDGWEDRIEQMKEEEKIVRAQWGFKHQPSYGMGLMWTPHVTMDAYDAAAPIPRPYETFSETFTYASGPHEMVGKRLPLPEHLPKGVKP